MGKQITTQCIQHKMAWIKLPKSCRWHFQIHFLGCKPLYFFHFHWRLLLCVRLTIKRHWSISPQTYEAWSPHYWLLMRTRHLSPHLANYLGNEQAKSHYLNHWWFLSLRYRPQQIKYQAKYKDANIKSCTYDSHDDILMIMKSCDVYPVKERFDG